LLASTQERRQKRRRDQQWDSMVGVSCSRSGGSGCFVSVCLRGGVRRGESEITAAGSDDASVAAGAAAIAVDAARTVVDRQRGLHLRPAPCGSVGCPRNRRPHSSQAGLPAESRLIAPRPAQTRTKPTQPDAADTDASIEHGFRRYTTVHHLHACDKLTWGGGCCRIQLWRIGCCERSRCCGRPTCFLFDSWSIHLHAALHCRLIAPVLLVTQHGE
jgi:hypothetical protein